MKKKFVVSRFDKLRANEAILKRSQIIGFPMIDPDTKKSQFCINNLEVPGSIVWDKDNQELVIRIRVNQEECLCLGDVAGFPKKVIIDGTD